MCLPLILSTVLSPITNTVPSTTAVQVPQSATSTPPPFKYIITIIEENHPLNGYSGILNNPSNDAPYLSGLFSQGALLKNYHDTANTGSLPNYFGMMSGQSPCKDDWAGNDSPCNLSGPTLVDTLANANLDWRAFMEDYPTDPDNIAPSIPKDAPTHVFNNAGCYMGGYNAGYLVNHNPFLYYASYRNNRDLCSKIVAAEDSYHWGELGYPNLFLDYLNSNSWANYIWLVPTHCDSFHGPFNATGPAAWPCSGYPCDYYGDPHTCVENQVKAGDKYLSEVIPQILQSKLFQTGQAALFINFDEPNSHPDSDPHCASSPYDNSPPPSDNCPIVGFWMGPTINQNYVSTNYYTHYSYLRTVEAAWGLDTLTNNDANAAPMTDVFNVPFPLKSSFTFDTSNPVTGQTVTFTGSATGGTAPYTFQWVFPRGTSGFGNDRTVSGTFDNDQRYTVQLTVTDSAGQSSTSKTNIVVTKPLASSFDYSPHGLTVGTIATFNPAVSGGQTPYSYRWDFGDDSRKSSDSNPTHKYTSLQSVTVQLEVDDALGHSSISSQTLVINPFSVTIDSTPDNLHPGDNVTVTATVNGGKSPYRYDWNFGDNNGSTSTSNTNISSHVYTAEGSFDVQLKVTDSNKVSSTASQTILVHAGNLAVAVTPSKSNALIGENVTFTSELAGGVAPYQYNWSFGDDQSSSSASTVITHRYNSPGNYSVTLNISDSAAHPQTGSAMVNIIVSPFLCSKSGTCYISAATGNLLKGDAVTFTATTFGGVPPYTFSWNFGDGTSGSGTSPTAQHTYTKSGSYNVILTITDTENHAYTSSTNITVKPSLQGGIDNFPALPITFLLVAFAAGAILSTGLYLVRFRLIRKFSG